MRGRLGKRQVEALMATYDDDPVAALSEALRIVLNQPDATFDQLVVIGALSADRTRQLLARDPAALDALAAELNELRTLER